MCRVEVGETNILSNSLFNKLLHLLHAVYNKLESSFTYTILSFHILPVPGGCRYPDQCQADAGTLTIVGDAGTLTIVEDASTHMSRVTYEALY